MVSPGVWLVAGVEVVVKSCDALLGGALGCPVVAEVWVCALQRGGEDEFEVRAE
jgi:hypothetical protein